MVGKPNIGLGDVGLLAGRRRVRVPVVPIVGGWRVVLDALEPVQVAGVGTDRLAVEEVDVPADLVVLAVVGVVARLHRQVERGAGDRTEPDRVDGSDHRLGDVRAEHLLRPVRRGEQAQRRVGRVVLVLEAVEVLDPHRRLGVDDVDVADLGEREHSTASPVAPVLCRDAQVGAHQVRLAEVLDDRCVATGTRGTPDEGLLERRAGSVQAVGPRRGSVEIDAKGGGSSEEGGRAQQTASGNVHASPTTLYLRGDGPHTTRLVELVVTQSCP